MIDTGGWSWAATHHLGFIKLAVRTGTPLFVFMFGMMLEIVYVRAARREGLGAVRKRLLNRSWQCYLGYALTAVAGTIGGYQTVAQGARALLFLDNTHFSNVLRLYAIVLLAAPLVVRFRLQFGIKGLVGVLGCIWVLDVLLLNRLDGASFAPVNYSVGFLVGAGPLGQGPSVVHGLTFVLVGMIVAGGLRNWQDEGLRRFYRYALTALALLVLVLAPLALAMGPRALAESYIRVWDFRVHNHFGYYTLGLALCIATLLTFAVVIPRGPLPPWTRVPLQFGQASLSSFAGGNILLALVPPGVLQSHLKGGAAVVASVAFVAVVLGIANGRRVLGLLPASRLFAPPARDAP